MMYVYILIIQNNPQYDEEDNSTETLPIGWNEYSNTGYVVYYVYDRIVYNFTATVTDGKITISMQLLVSSTHSWYVQFSFELDKLKFEQFTVWWSTFESGIIQYRRHGEGDERRFVNTSSKHQWRLTQTEWCNLEKSVSSGYCMEFFVWLHQRKHAWSIGCPRCCCALAFDQ